LCGPASFIDRARIWRKRLGGGMRQAGVLAACGLVSLRTMVDRLADDHANARLIAEGLQNLPGLQVDRNLVQTNMVLVDTDEPAEVWMERLATSGLACLPVGSHRLRLVLHGDITREMAERAIDIFKAACAQPVAAA
jgi:threonine aldolase